jgi:hypothetical protein
VGKRSLKALIVVLLLLLLLLLAHLTQAQPTRDFMPCPPEVLGDVLLLLVHAVAPRDRAASTLVQRAVIVKLGLTRKSGGIKFSF